ncbi:MAG: hypothetical protein QOE90_1627 [Thermoplasmata archaeon]|nr:hypothetical protein [Thermoplasmata archaeon]
MARVVVAIPTIDRDAYLREAIASVLAQTHRDLTCLVVDNGTKGVAAEVVRDFPDARVRYHRNPAQLSMARNWNRCVELAGPDADVLLLHDDDALLPDFLARALAALDAHPSASLAVGSVTLIDGKGAKVGHHRVAERDALVPGAEAFARMVRENFVRCPGVLVRRGVYAKAGGFEDIGFATDWGMWLRASLAGDVALLAEPVAKYRIGYGSDTDRLQSVRGELTRLESEEKAVARAAEAARRAGQKQAHRAARDSLGWIRARKAVALGLNGRPLTGLAALARTPGQVRRWRDLGYYAKTLARKRREEGKARAGRPVQP